MRRSVRTHISVSWRNREFAGKLAISFLTNRVIKPLGQANVRNYQAPERVSNDKQGDEFGNQSALVAEVHAELRQIAGRQMRKESPGHTLSTTALVNEAYLRLFGGTLEQCWENRAHFYGAAAEAMRRVLVDHARKKSAKKRSGRHVAVDMEHIEEPTTQENQIEEILDVDCALSDFERLHPEKAKLVKLRYFAGLTIPQVSKVMGISVATANRYWAFSRAWLFREISAD